MTNQAPRLSAPWKSSRASARDSSCSRDKAWLRAVVASYGVRSARREKAQGQCGLSFLATCGHPGLHDTRMANLLAGNTGDNQDRASTALELAFGSGWQREHIDQGCKSGSWRSSSRLSQRTCCSRNTREASVGPRFKPIVRGDHQQPIAAQTRCSDTS